MRKIYLLFALLLGVSSVVNAGDFTPNPSKVYLIKNVGNNYIPMFCVTQLKNSSDGDQKYILGARNNKLDSRSFFVIEGDATSGYTIRLKEVTEENGTTVTTNRYVSLKTGATNNNDHTIRTKIVSNVNNLTNNERWNITETAEGSGKYIISSKALTTTNSWNIRGLEYNERDCDDKVTGVGTWNDNTKPNNQWYIYSIDDFQQEFSKYDYEAGDNKGKVGYPVDEYFDNLNTLKTYHTSLCSAWSVSVANNFGNAYNYVSSTPINMPVNGKAYRFKNKAYGSTDTYWYFKYVDETTGLSTTANVAEATTFVCREISSGVYTFVCNDGKYLAWKGKSTDAGDKGANENKGYVNAYDYEENGTVISGTSETTQACTDWAQLTLQKLSGSNVNGQLADLWGYVSIKGRRASKAESNYFVLKADGQFDAANAPFFKTGSNSTNYSSAFILEEVNYPNTPTMTACDNIESGKKIATFSAKFPTLVPEGLSAYIISSNSAQSAHMEAIASAGEVIPANTGVLLFGETDETNVTMVPATTEGKGVTISTTNKLAHSAGAAITIGRNDNAYILANDATHGIAFYSCVSGTLAMNKAYLSIGGGSTNGKAFTLTLGGESTDIHSLENSTWNTNAPIYDLSGRRVQTPIKGNLYIQNGHKFIKQ